jgi:translation initiation factor 2 alpha subunit (eIF-2alpha)
MENTEGQLVTILRTSLAHRVQIAKSLLANNNIDSYIFDQNVTYAGLPSSEGYRLEVSSNDYEKAKKILEEVNSNDDED